MTTAFARRLDPALADWIEAEVAFPSSMVDRIVPAATPEDIDALEARLGVRDEGLVKTEPFSQWVVEDAFCGPRPPLERVGVQITRDVAGWERAKLRLLNGAHSALAYLGALAGHAYVHEAIAAPGYAAFIERLWDESEATLGRVDGLDSKAYRSALRARFANAALRHRTTQIAMDGSMKLPQRLVAPLRARLAEGRDSPALLLAIAAWMRWQHGAGEDGEPFVVDDPMAEQTRAAVSAGGGNPEAVVRALLALQAIFGDDLQQSPAVVRGLAAGLERLLSDGAARTVAAYAAR
jgi:fructuronate reductase